MQDQSIQAPVAKASAAIFAAAGADVTSSFFPSTLSEWMATLASAFAAVYTLTLLMEWWWKKFWRPLLVKRGVVKPPVLELEEGEYKGDGL